MAIRCSKDDTYLYEITLHGNDYHEIIKITGKEYSKDTLTIDKGGYNDVEPPKDPGRPFKIEVKKPISKGLINKQCHIQIKYPDGKIYGGDGFLTIIRNDSFVVAGRVDGATKL